MASKKAKQNDAPAKLFLQRELTKMMKTPCSEYFKVHGLVEDDIQMWEIFIIGPPNTLYENGVYKAIIEFPDDYPMKPPTMKFESEIWHPNIYKSGTVCISTLQTGQENKDRGQYWRPVLGVEQAILSVISLLSDPNTDDPANASAATMYKCDRETFTKRCKENAAKSLKELPEDFDYPKPVETKEEPKAIHKEDERKEIKDTEIIAVVQDEDDDDDDEWNYDIEDLSEYEYDSDDEPRPLKERTKVANKKHNVKAGGTANDLENGSGDADVKTKNIKQKDIKELESQAPPPNNRSAQRTTDDRENREENALLHDI